MKLLICCIIFFVLSSCNQYDSGQTQSVSVEETLMLDTLSITDVSSLSEKNIPALDSLDFHDNKLKSENSITVLEVPTTSKKIQAYFIDYVSSGNAFLTLVATDGVQYPRISIKNDAVASIVSILSRPYARFDTVNYSQKLRIYGYSENISSNAPIRLKPF